MPTGPRLRYRSRSQLESAGTIFLRQAGNILK